MSFSKPSLETIYQRIKADMEARLNTDRNITRFSFLGITVYVFAGAIYLLYGFLIFISDQLFISTATYKYLDRLGREYGLPRKAATFATGQVTFTGVETTVILADTLLQSQDGVEFATISEVTITGGSALADIQAETGWAGSIGNVEDTTLQLVSPITGVDSEATVTTPLSGGVDEETDDELRARLLQRTQTPPSSGTINDYIRWALEVPGVGRAWALSAEDYLGPGTVGVVIADSTLNIVDPAVKTAVEDNISANKPEVAYVDVNDIDRVNTNYYISITPNTTEFRDSITQSLEDLHLAQAAPNGTILLVDIQDAIYKTGINNYEITDIELNSVSIGVTDITTTGFETAVFNTVTFQDL